MSATAEVHSLHLGSGCRSGNAVRRPHFALGLEYGHIAAKGSRFCGLFALAVLIACTNSGPPTRVVTLSSGKQIKVRSVGPITFTEAPPGLRLAYETELRITDREALRKEVTEVWRDFRMDADRANVQSVIISANERATGFIITHNNAYNFVFERRIDSTWPVEAPQMK